MFSLKNNSQNLDYDKSPHSISDSVRSIALVSNNETPHETNEDALRQLKNNLKLVLKQQVQRYQPQRMIPIPGSIQSQHDYNDIYSPSAFENETNYQRQHDSSSRFSTNTVESTGEKPNQIVQQKRGHNSSNFPLPLTNPASNGLIALGKEVQPLSTSGQQKGPRPSSSQPFSSDAVFGSWSNDAIPEDFANDVFMNTLFLDELKMGKKKVPAAENETAKLGSSSASSDCVSKVDKSAQLLSVVPNTCNTSAPETQVEIPKASNFSKIVPNGDIKPSQKKKLKDKLKVKLKDKQSPSKPKMKQKRKLSSKRKPKFPLLVKDPPIEEQILALPSVTLAPSLLANMAMQDPRYNSGLKDTKDNGILTPNQTMTIHHPTRLRSVSETAFEGDGISASEAFRNILKDRDHDESYSLPIEGTEYDVVPSPLQLASYGIYLVWAIQSSDTSLIRKLLGAGLSPNPCNQFRDSVMGDLVCKHGKVLVYKCFVDEFHSDLRVADGFGRTLLHHCCWAQEFCRPIVEDILRRDPIQIFLKDKQDKTPLEYVSAEASGPWKRFLMEVADTCWPMGSTLPKLRSSSPGRRLQNGDLRDPVKALSPVRAVAVASGNITPEAVSSTSDLSNGKKRKYRR